MSQPRISLVLLLVAAFAAASATPSFAEKNDHRYARSAEALKKAEFETMCAGMKDNLNTAEGKADAAAGTKAAEKWAKAADSVWSTAHDYGCSWAQ